ncbi:MAG: putative peptidoglycan D,D-transpeptidase PenA [Syntrophomonadaceae bacterium]|nr:putative peptidoglycan D,D-transpeptidase PenA [Bacillota bacterium]
MITKWHRFRTIIVLSFVVSVFTGLLYQLYQIQIIRASVLYDKAQRQHNSKVALSPGRGTISDRRGKLLALNVSVDSIYAHPWQIECVAETSAKLSPLLGIPPDEIRRMLRSNQPFVWLARGMDSGKGEKVRELNLKGVGYLKEAKRFYPHRELASHILGFVNIDEVGLEGGEFYYDRYLRGESGWHYLTVDGRGREIIPFFAENLSPSRGHHLILTIDVVVQHIVERELNATIQRYGARDGSIIVINPFSGEILAMANYPFFDPNQFHAYQPQKRRNRAITDLFEPGSTFKVFTAAAALEEGAYNPNDKIFVEHGFYQFGSHIISDVNPRGWLTFSEVVEVSSNIGAAKIARTLGKETLYRYIRLFGFGSLTGVDFPGEIKGILRSSLKWSEICMGTISFGQGIGVTSVQLAAATSAIANGGVLIRPRLAISVVDDEGYPIKKFSSSSKRIISAGTADQLTNIMIDVVERGTARRAAVSGYQVAGKTGTAQKFIDGRFSDTHFTLLFIGYLPAERPEVAIVVVIDEPQYDRRSGVVAAELFQRVAEQTMSYLRVTGKMNAGK